MASESIIKLLTGAGVGSRRKVAALIKAGEVTVNGEAVTGFNHPVDAARDEVTVSGKPVALRGEKVVYLLMHKPAGVLSTAEDERGRRTVLDLLPARYRRLRLYPVGRLDLDSTGLLLLTNDGDLTYRLTHPRYEMPREYLVQTVGTLSRQDIERLEAGLNLEDGKTSPARVRPVVADPFDYSIVIHEGKKRQVRRMFGALGHPVKALKRVRLGSLQLGALKEGEVRELTAAEVKALRGKPK
ncbi:MAG: pseudouridine synthase [Chloroflexota bacterium]